MSKGAKKQKVTKGTKGMTGKKMTQIERSDKKGNDKAIKKAREKMKHTFYHGRNY